MDAETRRSMIYDVIAVDNDVVTPAMVHTPGSSARNAFEWLVGTDAYYICPDDPKLIQRYVTAKLHFQTIGAGWDECSGLPDDFVSTPGTAPDPVPEGPPAETPITIDLERSCDTVNEYEGENWLDAANECEWAFIRCDDDACITHIEVDENSVTGTLIDEIDWLTKLRVYTMDGNPNEIEGTIPTQFGNLPDLYILDLDENALTGPIPEGLYSATKLQQLDLDSNQLTGTISTLLGTLSDLRFLQIFNNPISGTFPNAELEQLSLIVSIGLQQMDLTGTVSDALCAMRDNQGGTIENLYVDCLEPAEVVCPGAPASQECCNRCF